MFRKKNKQRLQELNSSYLVQINHGCNFWFGLDKNHFGLSNLRMIRKKNIFCCHLLSFPS